MSLLNVGVFGKSQKENEKRVPIHPHQLDRIDPLLLKHIHFEKGYGVNFGVSDSKLDEISGGVHDRSELFKISQVALIAKPLKEDFEQMPPGAIHWGWPHCVQQEGITQVAIDRRLTLIAWEAMHRWSRHGDWQMHIFHKNNELAGYCGVQHAMNIEGMDGNYGPSKKAIVISFGSVSRGAVRALQARGVNEISVFTQRHSFLVADQMSGVNYYQFDIDEFDNIFSIHPNGKSRPFIDELSEADIIVNGILQNTDNPLMFVNKGQDTMLKPRTLVIDISCDEGMGFWFAKPTSFKNPINYINGIRYYGVDHTPSYLWDAASWEISSSLIPYLSIIMEGPTKWKTSETINRAIEIKDGEILNQKICNFQNRSNIYPHEHLHIMAVE